jgi:Ca2+-binding RTX toxin-like protein
MSDEVSTKTALHHALPQQFYDPTKPLQKKIGDAYAAMGFLKESIGNHINVVGKEDLRGVLIEEVTRVIQADATIPDGVIRASTVSAITGGYSPSHHSSNHPGYSDFFEKAALEIIDGVPTGALSAAQKQQLSDLHAFMRDVSAGAGFVSTDSQTGMRTVKFPGVQSATVDDLEDFYIKWNADRFANPAKYADVATYFQDFDRSTQKVVTYVDKAGVKQSVTLDATTTSNQPATKLQLLKDADQLLVDGTISEATHNAFKGTILKAQNGLALNHIADQMIILRNVPGSGLPDSRLSFLTEKGVVGKAAMLAALENVAKTGTPAQMDALIEAGRTSGLIPPGMLTDLENSKRSGLPQDKWMSTPQASHFRADPDIVAEVRKIMDGFSNVLGDLPSNIKGGLLTSLVFAAVFAPSIAAAQDAGDQAEVERLEDQMVSSIIAETGLGIASIIPFVPFVMVGLVGWPVAVIGGVGLSIVASLGLQEEMQVFTDWIHDQLNAVEGSFPVRTLEDLFGYVEITGSTAVLVGGLEDNHIFAQGNTQIVLADAGDDRVVMSTQQLGSPFVIVDGGLGEDTLSYAGGGGQAFELDGDSLVDGRGRFIQTLMVDTIQGSEMNDTLLGVWWGGVDGGDGDDFINVDALYLHGGDGNDEILLASPANSLVYEVDGGLGSDTIVIDPQGDSVVVDIEAQTLGSVQEGVLPVGFDEVEMFRIGQNLVFSFFNKGVTAWSDNWVRFESEEVGVGYHNGTLFFVTDAALDVSTGVQITGVQAVYGSDNTDVFVASEGGVGLYGQGGNDRYIPGVSGYTVGHFNGGDGVDTADYSTEVGLLVADVQSGVWNILHGCGADSVFSMEQLVGGSGENRITLTEGAALEYDGTQGWDSLGFVGYNAGLSFEIGASGDSVVWSLDGTRIAGASMVERFIGTGFNDTVVVAPGAYASEVDTGAGNDVVRGLVGDARFGDGADTWELDAPALYGQMFVVPFKVDGGSGTDTFKVSSVGQTLVYQGSSPGQGPGVWGRWTMPDGPASVELFTTGFEVIEVTGDASTLVGSFAVPSQAMRFAFEAEGVHLDLSTTLPAQRLFIDGRGMGTGGAAPGTPTTTVQALSVSGTSMAGTGLAWTVEGVVRLTGGAGADVLTAGQGQEIVGGAGNDRLVLALGDAAEGGAGADEFFWSPLASTTPLVQTIRDGEVGQDMVLVRRAGSTYVDGAQLVWADEVDAGGAVVGARATHTPTGRVLVFEGMTVAEAKTLVVVERAGDWFGTPGNDAPGVGGFADTTRAFGLGGNDTMTTDGGNVTLYGGAGDDRLSNTGRLLGNPDTAVLFGGAGNDTFLTSADRYTSATTVSYGDLLNPVVNGIGGADGVVLGNNRVVVQDGFGGRDTISLDFSDGSNRVIGSRFNDSMSTIHHSAKSTSSMRIDGGNGDDTLLAGGYADGLYGGNGNDQMSAASGSTNGLHDLFGGEGDDLLWSRGGTGTDDLHGDGGNDRLSGLVGGRDNLFGGSGNDLLITGNGSIQNQDTLNGGAGSDVIAFVSNNGAFGQRATVNGFTPGVADDPLSTGDVWVVNADAAARFVHTNATTPDFSKVVQVGANVHIGTIAVFVNTTRADVIAAFGGVQSNVDAYWLARTGAAGGGVSADGESALGGDGAANGDGDPVGVGPDPTTLPDDGAPWLLGGFERSEWLEMEAQAEADLLALLNGPGSTEFLFEDPTQAWVSPVWVDVA